MFVHIDPDSKPAKIILILGLPIHAGMLWFLLVSFSRAHQSQKWPAADGVISESRVERNWGIHGPHSTLTIQYTYVVAGKRLQNETVSFGPARGTLTWGYADRKAGQFPKGKAVKVLYKPDNPELACLEPGTFGWEDWVMMLFCPIGLALGMKELRNFARWLLAIPRSTRKRTSGCSALVAVLGKERDGLW